MTIRRWDPFAVLARVDDLNEFDNIVRRTWATPARNHSWVPPMDLVADGQDVVISLELPGLRVNDIDIEVYEGRLTVSAERTDRTSHLSEDSKTLVKELRHGSFRRDFSLPDGLEADAVSADYTDGILRLRVSGVSKPPAEPQKVTVSNATAVVAEATPEDEVDN